MLHERNLFVTPIVTGAVIAVGMALTLDLLLVGLPYRKKFGGDFAIGRTVPYVLQNASCEVLVVREPIASQVARGREPAVAVGAGLGASDRL